MKAAFVARACGARAAQPPAAPSGDRSWRGRAANGRESGDQEGGVCNRRNKVQRKRRKEGGRTGLGGGPRF